MSDDRRRDRDRDRDRRRDRDDIDAARRAIYGRGMIDNPRRSRSRSPSRGTDRRPISVSPDRNKHSRDRGRSPDRSRDRRFSRDQRISRDRSRSPPHRPTVSSNDPKLRAARVFVGRLPAGVTEGELEEIFKPYGKVLDVKIIKNFAFIQYENEEIARLAVERENGSLLKGINIDVKMADEGKKREDERPRYPGGRSPPPYGWEEPFREPYGSGDRDHFGRGPPGGDPYRRGPPPGMNPRDSYYDGFRPEREFRPPPPHIAAPPPRPAPAQPPSDRPPFECQFVLHQPTQRNYAEMIEDRLMALRMRCQHLVLKSDAELPLIITDITRRRVPYAIVLTAQNEQHRSLTLNILHGTPQEHRNMPLEDALGLMGRDFEEVRDKIAKGKGLGISPAVPAVAPPPGPGPRPPPNSASDPGFVPPSKHTHYLLNLLADNRILTLAELDNVMDYLVERRKKLAGGSAPPRPSTGDESKPNNGVTAPGPPAAAAEQAIDKQTAQLQNNILSILNGGDAPQPVPPPSTGLDTSVPSIPNLNFGDPSVQQALDNLIQSGPNLLKSISNLPTTSASQPPLPVQPPLSQQQAPPPPPPSSGVGMSGVRPGGPSMSNQQQMPGFGMGMGMRPFMQNPFQPQY